MGVCLIPIADDRVLIVAGGIGTATVALSQSARANHRTARELVGQTDDERRQPDPQAAQQVGDGPASGSDVAAVELTRILAATQPNWNLPGSVAARQITIGDSEALPQRVSL